MEIKKYIVLTKEGEHDYNIEVETSENGEKYSIFASNNPSWTEHTMGTLLLSLTDDGNGLIWSKNIKKVEYYDGTYMMILLKLRLVLDKANESDFKIIEDKESILV